MSLDVDRFTGLENRMERALDVDELGRGALHAASRRAVLEIIRRPSGDAVILGCTELPLLVGPSDTELPPGETRALHVDSILERAAAERVPPLCPGGGGVSR